MDIMRKDTSKQYRAIRKILVHGRSYYEADHIKQEDLRDRILKIAYYIAVIGCILFMLRGCGNDAAYAYTADKIAAAIGKAENSKSHPYGIMVRYRHTSPKQACINTILHQWRNYSKLVQENGLKQPFISYLAEHYAPIGASNDPNGLNRNWQRNVSYFLRGIK